MATLTIPDSIYQRLKDMAASRKLPLEQFLEQAAISAFGDSLQAEKPGTVEWMNAFDAWVASHSQQRGVIADDSRDTIYGDERD